MDANDDLSSFVFYRRHNIQRTARDVDRRRQSELKDFSFPDIVFIATFGAVSDIPKYTPSLVQRARHRNGDFSFFDYWQKYCKALLDPARRLAVYEGAIFLASEALPEDEVQGWHKRHQDALSRLRHLGPAASCQDGVSQIAPNSSQYPSSESPGIRDDDDNESAKRRGTEGSGLQDGDQVTKKRRVEETSIQLRHFEPPNERVFPMHLAARDRLTTILSSGLWEGIQASRAWTNEPHQALTQTLCLFWPEVPGDFILDLIVSKACAKWVSEATLKSDEDALRVVLGDFLFKGVMESNLVKDHGELTDAVVTRDYGDGDGVVRVVLCHLLGWEASRVFPST